MSRLSTNEAAQIIGRILQRKAEPVDRNWVCVNTTEHTYAYFSQCKPSAAGRGKWHYDFFHTLGFETIQDIGKKAGLLVLLNYIDKTYAVLDCADLMWVVKYSSRPKSNSGLVCDFVIDRDVNGNYNLRPYARQNKERRQVEVKQW